MISYTAAKMVDHIKSERIEMPDMIVHIHSHPLGAPALSDVDKQTIPGVATQMSMLILLQKHLSRSLPRSVSAISLLPNYRI